jgi:quercetin dioxygenase-like cupin family protein
MHYKYPHTIENCTGEKLVFLGVESSESGDKLLVEGFCQPGAGPLMHTHFRQDEALTVVSGQMGYQILGEAPHYAGVGQTVLFQRGVSHRFWAEGEQPLHIKGWVAPAHSLIFFLSSLYAAQNKAGSGRPETFDGAYLLTRYKSEYDVAGVPPFVKKVILPTTYYLGRLLGRYKHFAHAPEPLKD